MWLIGLAPLLLTAIGDGPSSLEEAKATGARKVSFKPPVMDEQMQESVVRTSSFQMWTNVT
jgi:hypothetical protein